MITLYDADRCPYCARVRIVLAEKGIAYETVAVDLDPLPHLREWVDRLLERESVAAESELVAAL